MLNERWRDYFFDIAAVVARQSKDPSTKVGAVLVDPETRTIISTGFNGFPRGMEDRPEWYNERDEKYPRIIHAEMNALLHAHRCVKGSHMFVYGLPPCERCAVHMVQAGVRNVSTRVLAGPGAYERWVTATDKAERFLRESGVGVGVWLQATS
jgi:dCMP deaminase